jgi:TRAP-type C4-dicarboxylate transport system permease small subunit
MQTYIKIVTIVSRLFGYLSAMMILLAVLITCEMIFVRFVLGHSTVWQTETVVYLCVGATILGLPYVQILKGHVNVDLIPSLLPPAYRKALLGFSYLMSIGIIGLMLFYGFEAWEVAYRKNWKSDTVNEVPLWLPYLVMPVGFGLYLLQLFSDMLVQVFGFENPENLHNKES